MITATIIGALLLAGTVKAASVSTLHRRENHQRQTLHRDRGTVLFFTRHGWLLYGRTHRVAHRALRFARAEIRWTLRELAQTRNQEVAHLRASMTVPKIICTVFGSHCQEALTVAECESHYSVDAVNGQYYGVFQMGSGERARFGGSSTDPWDQVRAAYRYFTLAGWGPWECRA